MEVEEASIQTIPEPFVLECQVFGLDFHPSSPLIGMGLINGDVRVSQYTPDSKSIASFSYHSKSCRDLLFSPDGQGLITASSDLSIGVVDLNTTRLTIHKQNAHDCKSAPLYCLVMHEHMLASGDESGCIKVWDLRQKKQVFSWRQHEDFISQMTFDPSRNTLLSASADGRLAVFNVNSGRIEGKSDQQEDELLSVIVAKEGKKVVCGSQEGVINIWNWGEWGDISDRFPGHPKSIDSIVKIDEDTIFTGSSDGIIRIVGIHPNKLLGVVGEHSEFPIERIKLSYDSRFLASCSHDSTVKFWDVSFIFEEDLEGSTDDNKEDVDHVPTSHEAIATKNKKSNFFDGLM